jgi:hypothetical protein
MAARFVTRLENYPSDDSSELEGGAHDPIELESNLSDGETKQPPAKRRKHASSVVGSRPNSKPTTAKSTHE